MYDEADYEKAKMKLNVSSENEQKQFITIENASWNLRMAIGYKTEMNFVYILLFQFSTTINKLQI